MPDLALRLEPGVILQDTYRIVRRIGQGGMGEVYEATHARLSGRYAVKFLLGEFASSPEAFARFRREAEVTSALRHPSIVQVIDFNRTPEGAAYLVMEFLEGTELSREIQRIGPFPVARVREILAQTASALAAAHKRGIVHRDLKPDNLFLVRLDGEERDLVKILDFGISKVKEATVRLTREASLMGTPHYMAPEQALGKISEIDPRSDQFALAAIVYEMLAGREPFQGDSLAAVIYQVVHEHPAPLRQFNPAVTAGLEAVVRRALSKQRDARFADVREFAHAFATAAGVPVTDLTPAPVATVPEVPQASPALARAAPVAGRAGVARKAPVEIPKTTFTTAAGETWSDAGRGPRPVRRLIALGVGAVGVIGLLALAFRPSPAPTHKSSGAAVPFVFPSQPAAAADPPPVAAIPAPPPVVAVPPPVVPLAQPAADSPAAGKNLRRKVANKKAKPDPAAVAAPITSPPAVAPAPAPAPGSPERRPRGKLILDF